MKIHRHVWNKTGMEIYTFPSKYEVKCECGATKIITRNEKIPTLNLTEKQFEERYKPLMESTKPTNPSDLSEIINERYEEDFYVSLSIKELNQHIENLQAELKLKDFEIEELIKDVQQSKNAVNDFYFKDSKIIEDLKNNIQSMVNQVETLKSENLDLRSTQCNQEHMAKKLVELQQENELLKKLEKDVTYYQIQNTSLLTEISGLICPGKRNGSMPKCGKCLACNYATKVTELTELKLKYTAATKQEILPTKPTSSHSYAEMTAAFSALFNEPADKPPVKLVACKFHSIHHPKCTNCKQASK